MEEPLEIRVRNKSVSITMRTPGHDEELAAGLMLSEGLVRTREDILGIDPCARNEHGNAVNVRVAPLVHIDLGALARHVITSSSCGVCGKASIDAIRSRLSPVLCGVKINPRLLCSLPDVMKSAQKAFSETGGLHAAAIFDDTGRLLILREDVGRHNAVDKAVGRLFLDGLTPLDRHILLVSGRTSFEIMQKAAAAGIGVIASVSAPSSLAVQMAGEMNQTLVGFLRPPRFNVYTHAERIGE
jgi:FdhD protein